MKRALVILKLAHTLLLLIALLLSAVTSQAEQPSSIRSSIRIAISEYPPYEYTDSEQKQIKGFSAEMIQAVLTEMKVEISEYSFFPWKRALNMVYQGKFDAIHSASTTPDRLENCWFPEEPIVASSKMLLVHKDNAETHTFNSYEDLKGRVVGIVRGFSYPQDFLKFLRDNDSFYEVVNIDQLFSMLQRKRIDYMVSESLVAKAYLKNKRFKNELVFLPKPIQVKPMYLIFSKQSVNKTFVEAFSSQLTKFKTTSAYYDLCDKYQVTCKTR